MSAVELHTLDAGVQKRVKAAKVLLKKHGNHSINGESEQEEWIPKSRLEVFGIVEGFGRHRNLVDIYHCPPTYCHAKRHPKISAARFISKVFKLLIWLSALGMLLYYLIVRGKDLTEATTTTYVVTEIPGQIEAPNILLCDINQYSFLTLSNCALYETIGDVVQDAYAAPIQNCSTNYGRIEIPNGNATYDCLLFTNLAPTKSQSNVYFISGYGDLDANDFFYGVTVGLFFGNTTPSFNGLIFTANGFVNYIIYQRNTMIDENNKTTYNYDLSLSTLPIANTWSQNTSYPNYESEVEGYDAYDFYLIFSPLSRETQLQTHKKDFFDYLEQFGGAVAIIEFWLGILLFGHFAFKQYYYFCVKTKKKPKKNRELHMSSDDA